jgi:hypothetical protein
MVGRVWLECEGNGGEMGEAGKVMREKGDEKGRGRINRLATISAERLSEFISKNLSYLLKGE